MRTLILIPTIAALLLAGCQSAPPPDAPTDSFEANAAAEAPAGATDSPVAGAEGGDGEAENAAATIDDGATAMADSSEAMPAPEEPYCPAVGQAASAAQCRRFTQERATMEAGIGVFNPPREMEVGAVHHLVLAVGRRGDAAEVHEAVGGEAKQRVELRTAVGHLMTATLSGGGFKITPEGPQQKTLSADRREGWEWDVEAVRAGTQKLLLVISVDSSTVDGRATRYELARRAIDIQVKVTEKQRKEEETQALEAKLKRGERVMSALEKWLIGLAALVVAAGGVWIALRSFGKRKEDQGGDAAPPAPPPPPPEG